MGGGPGGSGGGIAPPVSIDPVAVLIWRNNGKVEISVHWTKGATATAANFTGVAVYLEDPDISSGSENPPLDISGGPGGIPRMTRPVGQAGRGEA